MLNEDQSETISFLRNEARGTTAVGAYSPRVRAGFPLAMPVTWREVEKGIFPDAFTLESPPKLAGSSRPRRARRAARGDENARALKVFRTPVGFYDAAVAAPSQKAALAAGRITAVKQLHAGRPRLAPACRWRWSQCTMTVQV